MESVEKERETTRAMLPEDNSILGPTVGRERITPDEAVAVPASAETTTTLPVPDSHPPTINDAHVINDSAARLPLDPSAPAPPEPTRKRDWL
jgi:hypothetical protein